MKFPVPHIEHGALKRLPELLMYVSEFLPVSRCVIITDSFLEKKYGKKVRQDLLAAGLRVDMLVTAPGEKSKNEKTYSRLVHALFRMKCGRDTMILALGGGVVGDLAGYVAATYMRGIPYVQIPTTLLAMVDSSIGGKVAIDTAYGKNLLGAFHHPAAIISDLSFLNSLPREQLLSGAMEMVKIFLTYDAKFFEMMRGGVSRIFDGDVKFLQKMIERAVALKMAVVKRDERETSGRVVLNFGHTIGHAIEHLSGYRMSHGRAVALGMLVESKMSELSGVLSAADFERVRDGIAKFGVGTDELADFDISDILRQVRLDKKARSGNVRYVLLKRIGDVKVTGRGKDRQFSHEVDAKIVRQAFQFFTQAHHVR